MFVTTEHRNGTANTHEGEMQEGKGGLAVDKAQRAINGTAERRLLIAPPARPTVVEDGKRDKAKPVLAVFCYEEPTSAVGQFLVKAAAALARRDTSVHVFTRLGIEVNCAGAVIHEVGEPDDGDLFERVQEFTHRAGDSRG